MRTVTQAEWDRTHSDYKAVREDGTRYMLRLDPETGATISEPVRIAETKSTDEEGGIR